MTDENSDQNKTDNIISATVKLLVFLGMKFLTKKALKIIAALFLTLSILSGLLFVKNDNFAAKLFSNEIILEKANQLLDTEDLPKIQK